MVSISQNSDFMNDTSSLIPTLMRSTLLWRVVPAPSSSGQAFGYDNRFDRPLLAEEHLAAQGVPVPVLLPKSHIFGGSKCPLVCYLDRFGHSPQDLRKLAGNSMHVSSVGSMLLFMIMTLNLRRRHEILLVFGLLCLGSGRAPRPGQFGLDRSTSNRETCSPAALGLRGPRRTFEVEHTRKGIGFKSLTTCEGCRVVPLKPEFSARLS